MSYSVSLTFLLNRFYSPYNFAQFAVSYQLSQIHNLGFKLNDIPKVKFTRMRGRNLLVFSESFMYTIMKIIKANNSEEILMPMLNF